MNWCREGAVAKCVRPRMTPAYQRSFLTGRSFLTRCLIRDFRRSGKSRQECSTWEVDRSPFNPTLSVVTTPTGNTVPGGVLTCAQRRRCDRARGSFRAERKSLSAVRHALRGRPHVLLPRWRRPDSGAELDGSRRVDHRGPVSGRLEAWRRRHGSGLPGGTRPHEAAVRRQSHAPAAHERPGRGRPIQPRSGEREPDLAPERLRRLRLRRDRQWADLPRDGVHRRRVTVADPRAGKLAHPGSRGGHHLPDRGRAQRRARPRHPAPRSEAGQHHDREVARRHRPREDRGLRHRARDVQGIAAAHVHRDRGRNARVHEPRAVCRRRARRADRHLLARARRLPRAHRNPRVRFRDDDRPPARSSHAAAASPVAGEGGRRVARFAAGGVRQGTCRRSGTALRGRAGFRARLHRSGGRASGHDDRGALPQRHRLAAIDSAARLHARAWRADHGCHDRRRHEYAIRRDRC